MTWGQEIFRALLLTFGITEVISNITYLIKENGLDLARKQHTELPQNVSNKKIKLKVVCMLFFGASFFLVSLITYILHRYIPSIIFITSILFCFYGIIEALYYKYWRTFGFAFTTILLVIASAII